MGASSADNLYIRSEGVDRVAGRRREIVHGVPVIALLIRGAGADDFGVVSDLYRRSSLSNDGDRDALLGHPEALVFPSASIREGRTRVAVSDGRIVGFATTRAIGRVAELDDLFVDPDWMRRGVARALVHDALAIGKARGTTRIDVTANPHALAFYEAVGFVVDGVTETEFGVGTRMHLDVDT
jgi:GNAT superfamily N-acetyltransferase